jgi:hypothetical protein
MKNYGRGNVRANRHFNNVEKNPEIKVEHTDAQQVEQNIVPEPEYRMKGNLQPVNK